MIEQGHTPEPWHRSNTLILDSGGHYVAGTKDYHEIEQVNATNAARIVACVNALAGLNPEGVAGMVAALEYAVNWAEGYAAANGDTPAFLSDARAALAKLEGRQNA